MSDPLILLADSVTASINTAEDASAFSPLSFTARRSYPDWPDDFEDLKQLAVDVVPVVANGSAGIGVELDAAALLGSEQAVDVCVRYHFPQSDRENTQRLKNAAIDRLITLVGQLHKKLAENRDNTVTLASGIAANWLNASVRTYCDYSRLRQGNFLGVVRVRYDISEENS